MPVAEFVTTLLILASFISFLSIVEKEVTDSDRRVLKQKISFE